MKTLITVILPLVGIFLMAFGIQFLFNVDWKWMIVVLYVADHLKLPADDIQTEDI